MSDYKLGQINSLRGWAIIIVMVSHSTTISNFGYIGIYGVQLFYYKHINHHLEL